MLLKRCPEELYVTGIHRLHEKQSHRQTSLSVLILTLGNHKGR